MFIGYARVSTDDQTLDFHRDALQAKACSRIGILEHFETARGPAAAAIAGDASPESASVSAAVGSSRESAARRNA